MISLTHLLYGVTLVLVIAAFVIVHTWRMRKMQRREFALMVLSEERGHAERRYRELFENAADAVFTTDLDGNFTELNRRAEALIGYSRAEARGVNLRQLLPDSEAGEQVVQQWINGLADGSERIDIISRSGERIPVEVSTRVVEDAGYPVGMQAIARDVSERAALERQLRQSQKMEAIGQLAGGVAHDFNNLLTVIRGNTELLLEDVADSASARADLEQIKDAASRASSLTRQLLAFSRKQVVQPQQVDLNKLLRGLESMLQRLIGEDVKIETALSSDPAWVFADPGQIEQVVLNLVVNARDAMPQGGSVTIETSLVEVAHVPEAPVPSASGRAVVIAVTDTGTGMDFATQMHIFEPFFTTKEVGKGTGLGLSTVYGIVQQANGQIVCSSQVGRGTTFRIYLPYIEVGKASEASAAEQSSAPIGHETILLVEDEEAVRDLTSRVLRKAGYQVIEARDGQIALNTANDHPGSIDLLLTDVVLPVINGLALAEQLTQTRPDLRVLLMSGYTDDEILRRGLHQPRTAYLQKPFTLESLTQRVRAVLDAEEVPAGDEANVAA